MAVASKKRGAPKQTRAEKSEAIRQAIFFAAAKVVGEDGYADASISKITAQAHVAHGTFYNYFESRQDLFGQLLPHLGQLLLNYVTEQVAAVADPVLREEWRLAAWFNFLRIHPEFFRILNEAEVFAPEVFRRHVTAFGEGYLRALQRARHRGELTGFEPQELEPLAYILLAARVYLTSRYVQGGASVPEFALSAYTKLIRHGLFAGKPEGIGQAQSGRKTAAARRSNGKRGIVNAKPVAPRP